MVLWNGAPTIFAPCLSPQIDRLWVVSVDQFPNSVVVFLRNNPAYLRHHLQNIDSFKKF